MGVTKQIPRDQWKRYFERYTREHLGAESDSAGDVHPAAVVEVLSPEFGDQFAVTLLPLLGMTFDPKSNAFELVLEDIDHLAFRPVEISVVQERDGFISALELVRADGIKEIVQLRRSGPPASIQEAPSHPEG